MRERRAAANGITIYEMVRNEELYPLEQYLDAADLALLRDPSNEVRFLDWMKNEDEGMRWWGVVGLHLIETSSKQAKEILHNGLTDPADEIKIMSAWSLVKIGEREQALQTLDSLLFQKPTPNTNTTMLHNVIDWMGEPALPLVKKYVQQEGNRQGKYGIGILGRIAQLNGW